MSQFRYFAVYKPFGMLSQFSGEEGDSLLGELFDFPKEVYPVGRLDKDSEGLLLLTNDKSLNHQLLNPRFNHWRTYWIQVEGDIDAEALQQLEKGVSIRINKKAYRTKKAKVSKLEDAPSLPERIPPIRYRKTVPTSWISLSLSEGKNRQVRRMTAAVGFPTLRLVRAKIEDIAISDVLPEKVRELKKEDVARLLKLRQ